MSITGPSPGREPPDKEPSFFTDLKTPTQIHCDNFCADNAEMIIDFETNMIDQRNVTLRGDNDMELKTFKELKEAKEMHENQAPVKPKNATKKRKRCKIMNTMTQILRETRKITKEVGRMNAITMRNEERITKNEEKIENMDDKIDNINSKIDKIAAENEKRSD